ncbi:MAG: hypothetical protein ABIT05_15515 [Chitinophagaceae bacterium]
MKVKLLLLLPALLLSMAITAQKNTSQVKNDKYRINLPSYWGKGHKVWKILIDKLPLVCEELAGKELCGDDCNPAYTVDFYLTEPTVVDFTTKKIITPADPYTRNLLQKSMNFESSGNLYYPNNTSIVDSWQAFTNYSFQCFLLLKDAEGKILTRMILVDTNEIWERPHPETIKTNTPPDMSYMEKNKEKFNPVIFDLLAIVEKKILGL